MNAFPAHAFFVLVRGKELLYAPSEDYKGSWEPARAVVSDNPRCEEVEMILKEKMFREVMVESVERIDDPEHHLYLCVVSSQSKARLGQAYGINQSNRDRLPSLTELGQKVLSLPIIQSRLN